MTDEQKRQVQKRRRIEHRRIVDGGKCRMYVPERKLCAALFDTMCSYGTYCPFYDGPENRRL